MICCARPRAHSGQSLTWDAASQLTQEVSNDGTVNFSYDVTGQLTGVTGWRSETYTYDALGNRTMSGYQTGTGNRLLSDGTFNYTYDNEGNLLTKTEIATGKVTQYSWDYRNRLTSVTVKDSSNNVIQQSNYTYDPFDKRIGVSFDPDGAGAQPATQTWTVYDGMNPYADFNGSGNLTYRYLYGPAVDMIVGRFSASADIAWHLPDHLGTVRDLANTSGSVIDHIKYDSFGKVLSESNPSNGDRFKFTARELDGTGDYYYRARYYGAAIGRFTSEDPKGLAAGDANVFRYCANGPTGKTDPTGREPEPAEVYTDPQGQMWYRGAYTTEWLPTGGGDSASSPGGPGFWSSLCSDAYLMASHPLATAGGAASGAVDGLAMIGNAAIFHSYAPLNDYVNQVVDQNGGLYDVAYYSAHVGVYAGYLAVAVVAVEALLGIGASGGGATTVEEVIYVTIPEGGAISGANALTDTVIMFDDTVVNFPLPPGFF